MQTKAIVRTEHGSIIDNDMWYGQRRVSWRDETARDEPNTEALLPANGTTVVTTWTRSRQPEAPRPRPQCTCSRELVCTAEFSFVRIEHEPTPIPAACYTRNKDKRFRPLPFKKRFWRYYNKHLIAILADRHYSEKDFASLPAHYRRLLRFGPMPQAREVTNMEQLLASLDTDTPREKTFDDLINAITR